MTGFRVSRGVALVGNIKCDPPVDSPAGVIKLVPKVLKVPIAAGLTTGAKDTTVDLPTKGIVLDVFVDVTTAESTGSTKTIDVGLLASESGGDADGFLDG